jgi:transposase InsO family protein
VAADFFVVPTVTYRLVFVLVLLAHDRRRIRHVAVTAASDGGVDRPTVAGGVSVGRGTSIPDSRSRSRLRQLTGHGEGDGVEDVLTAPRAPWQNAFVERCIGSTRRRECFDHVIVFNEAGLKRLMTLYCSYYEPPRTQMSLNKDAPIPRQIGVSNEGHVVAIPQVGGLHHRNERRAA